VNRYDEQADEVESLQYIYPDEMTIKTEKPYNFEIMINSNTESEERNFLKLIINFDLQQSYPNCVPYFRVKNLSPEYMDNAMLDKFETELRTLAEE